VSGLDPAAGQDSEHMPAELFADDASPRIRKPAPQAAAGTQPTGRRGSLADPDRAPAPAVRQDAAPSVPLGPAATSQQNTNSVAASADAGAASPALPLAGAFVCAGGDPVVLAPEAYTGRTGISCASKLTALYLVVIVTLLPPLLGKLHRLV